MPRFAAIFAVALAAVIQAIGQHTVAESFETTDTNGVTLQAFPVATFDEPWAMTFLPDGTMLVTTKPGKLFHVTRDGVKTEVAGMWDVAYGGQGGLGDVVLHPDFSQNNLVYISNVETQDGGDTFRAVVWRVRFDRFGATPTLADAERIWTQRPNVSGRGHFSHRIALGPDGMLFITSGDRQKLTPAQDLTMSLGKIIRLYDDGRVADDNPWQTRGELAKTFWTMGHRNILGIDFDREGRLWTHEMGPRHGDELNLIVRGENYGWPVVSNGNHYSGARIPDHHTRPEFNAPKAFWVPAISPAGFVIYDGEMFPDWQGDGFIGGLSSRALIRVDISGENAREAGRFEWGKSIREIEQGPEGALWVLEDDSDARLLRLTPKD